MIILIDDRERKPWKFPGVETEEARLETGDYSVKGFEDRFAVERKSLNDLATSVGSERNRFEAEIQRAQDFDEFAVVVEASREDAAAGRYYSQIHPNAVTGTVEKWPFKYGILEFVWAGENEDGEKVRDLPAARDHAPQEALRLLDRWYLKAASDLF
ncbi:ERCC4 endonuclease [Halorubrum tailed virus 25]|uniref:ERCC4 domain-containing protein EP364R n=1 Tax=Halorubrum tailed virus 25 TaxID=2878006 RepID=A0AAE8XZV9_9CAUD|nr:ERCC4-type nuclease [Halorubrum tailed virus 25]UBF22654.1 ERCC4 endonuclease [Halorubrum tailed virus 25]